MSARHRWSAGFAASLLVAMGACTTIRYTPEAVDLETFHAELGAAGPVAVRARAVPESAKSRMAVEPYTVVVAHDEATAMVVDRLVALLEAHGVNVEPAAANALEIEVVHVAMRPGAPMRCTVDVTLHPREGPPRGIQGWDQAWSYATACDRALARAAVRIVEDAPTRALLLAAP